MSSVLNCIRIALILVVIKYCASNERLSLPDISEIIYIYIYWKKPTLNITKKQRKNRSKILDIYMYIYQTKSTLNKTKHLKSKLKVSDTYIG